MASKSTATNFKGKMFWIQKTAPTGMFCSYRDRGWEFFGLIVSLKEVAGCQIMRACRSEHKR